VVFQSVKYRRCVMQWCKIVVPVEVVQDLIAMGLRHTCKSQCDDDCRLGSHCLIRQVVTGSVGVTTEMGVNH
jgi:hypothetical protein